ncbi:hypothetical protein LINGRAHAP2_LOCUS28282, partial [Linum grandiflorum]
GSTFWFFLTNTSICYNIFPASVTILGVHYLFYWLPHKAFIILFCCLLQNNRVLSTMYVVFITPP